MSRKQFATQERNSQLRPRQERNSQFATKRNSPGPHAIRNSQFQGPAKPLDYKDYHDHHRHHHILIFILEFQA